MHSPSVKISGRSGWGTVRGDTTTSAIPSKKLSGTSWQSRRTMVSKSASRIQSGSRERGAGSNCPRLLAPGSKLLPDVGSNLIQPHPLLLHRVAVADCHAARREGIAIDRDAERSAGFVHPAIAPSYRSAVVVEAGESPPEIVIQRGSDLGHPVLLHQREHSGLDRSHAGMQPQHHSRFPLHLLLAIGVDQEGERDAVSADRRLDDVGEVPLI